MTGESQARPRRPLEVAFVCTGNRFRSPLAAAYFRRLSIGASVAVSSCGTASVTRTARPPLPEALEIAVSSAVDLGSHRTMWVGAAALGDADLVIGFERSHIAAAVLEGGADRRVTFLLAELVGLLESVEVPPGLASRARIEALVAAADAARGSTPPRRAKEVADPFGRSRRFYERTAREVWDLTVTLAGHLFPGGPDASVVLPRPRLRRSLGILSVLG